MEGKGACVVYRTIDAFYLLPKQGSDTWKKKKKEREREEKRIAAEWPVKIAGAVAAVPNNQIRPYFPGPQLQYRPRPPLNSKKALARPVSQNAKKKKKENSATAGAGRRVRRGRGEQERGTSLHKNEEKKVEGAHTRRTSPRSLPPPNPSRPPPPFNHRALPPRADGWKICNFY